MNEQELVGIINSYSKLAGSPIAWNALRAVVELHKPLTPHKHMCDCNYCPPFDCEKCETFYPCSTIQAIEKELNATI